MWLENCPLSEKDIQDILKAVGKFGGLERLHLINMQHIQKALPLIKTNFKDHKNLKELDIQNNQIDDYHELVELITDNETLEKLNIKGNYMDEESLEAIWVGLNDNIKLKSFLFDSIDKVLEE